MNNNDDEYFDFYEEEDSHENEEIDARELFNKAEGFTEELITTTEKASFEQS